MPYFGVQYYNVGQIILKCIVKGIRLKITFDISSSYKLGLFLTVFVYVLVNVVSKMSTHCSDVTVYVVTSTSRGYLWYDIGAITLFLYCVIFPMRLAEEM